MNCIHLQVKGSKRSFTMMPVRCINSPVRGPAIIFTAVVFQTTEETENCSQHHMQWGLFSGGEQQQWHVMHRFANFKYNWRLRCRWLKCILLMMYFFFEKIKNLFFFFSQRTPSFSPPIHAISPFPPWSSSFSVTLFPPFLSPAHTLLRLFFSKSSNKLVQIKQHSTMHHGTFFGKEKCTQKRSKRPTTAFHPCTSTLHVMVPLYCHIIVTILRLLCGNKRSRFPLECRNNVSKKKIKIDR